MLKCEHLNIVFDIGKRVRGNNFDLITEYGACERCGEWTDHVRYRRKYHDPDYKEDTHSRYVE